MPVTIVLILLTLVGVAHAQLSSCAAPVGPLLPDLLVDRRALKADRLITQEIIETNSCELVEGCVGASGSRRLLRFTTLTPNLGQTALVIESPAECSLLFHFSECHGHYHLEQYADYRLWTKAGFKTWRKHRDWTQPVSASANQGLLDALSVQGEFLAGRKQGFCMLDSVAYQTNSLPVFTDCITNQGISAGWADLYRASLDCQFIDITGLAHGRYVLEVEVNPDRVLPESDYQNNSAVVRVRDR